MMGKSIKSLDWREVPLHLAIDDRLYLMLHLYILTKTWSPVLKSWQVNQEALNLPSNQ